MPHAGNANRWALRGAKEKILKAHVVTLAIIDMDDIGAEEIKAVIENAYYPNRCISPDVVNVETADIGEWDDDHPLNSNVTSETEWRRLFPSLPRPTKRLPDVGQAGQ